MSSVDAGLQSASEEKDRMLDWVEKQAIENLQFHIQCAEQIKKEATTTLTVILAGVGGASAYTVKLFDAHVAHWLMAAALAFALGLLVVAAILVLRCLHIDNIQAPANEPKNLYLPKYSLQIVREVELENVQLRIKAAQDRNGAAADRLERVRVYAVLVPVISAAVGGMVWAASAFHVAAR
ncbi:hypothetical protein [Burkholderia sp. LA-2-3-30-S1-D2]|uniref:hypothetical protein n=1 Tax=Burkholderia sp. LA-2-3-30-S1-D2 TaxID=1637862 RepID=UPI0007521F61|nr:hypothetical protein [Burkholderia sp. LA-2-3-30-S1-D2]AOI94830.1 hypothetical protein WS66_03765 [Burkholderia sp. LA-2-3-30-S1-D2]KVE19987.1 hypothetical protein WS66_01705 [Burkholderia sp. LA-2-3-30-S1-D2]